MHASWGILFVLMLLGFWQCKSHRAIRNDPEPGDSRGLLWRISGEQMEGPSYLFGTIHMIPAESYFLPEGTPEAIDSSVWVFFEVDITAMDDPAEQMAVLAKSFMKDDISLSDLLSKSDYALVKSHFDALGIPLFLLERVKPMFLTVFSDNTLFNGPIDEGKLKFYELEFAEMARQKGKEIRGLEGIDYQLSLMDSIPYEDQARMLVESIREEASGNSQMDTLVSLYTDQNIGALYASFANDSLSVYDSLLLINRNHNWIPVMQEAMMERSCFFAVGAAHLPGSDGVIRLLRKQGYQVVPVGIPEVLK